MAGVPPDPSTDAQTAADAQAEWEASKQKYEACKLEAGWKPSYGPFVSKSESERRRQTAEAKALETVRKSHPLPSFLCFWCVCLCARARLRDAHFARNECAAVEHYIDITRFPKHF